MMTNKQIKHSKYFITDCIMDVLFVVMILLAIIEMF